MKVQNAEEFEERSMIEINKELAKMWRELSKEQKDKVTKSFEKVFWNYIVWNTVIFINILGEKTTHSHA